MQIGYNQICINPTRPTAFAGSDIDKTIYNVKGDLFARCLRLKDEKNNIVLLTMDLFGMTEDIKERFSSAIRECLNQDVYVIVHCTHTHYAPSFCNKFDLMKPDKRYIDYTISKVVLMIRNCRMLSRELSVCYNRLPFHSIGTNRLSGERSDEIYAGVLSFYDKQIRIGSFVFYNCHPTILQEEANYFSSEYPGILLNTLVRRYPSEFFMFMQGACGDVSTRFTRRSSHYEEVIRMGNELVQICECLLKKNDQSDKTAFNISLSEETIMTDNEIKDPTPYLEHTPSISNKRTQAENERAMALASRMRSSIKPFMSEIRISSLRIGPYNLVFNPFEMCSDYNKMIDKDQTLLVCFSQGLAGYLTKPNNKLASYEYFMETLVEEDKKKVVKLLKNL